MMRSSVWLSAMGICRPDILDACQSTWNQGKTDAEFVRVGREAFAECPSDSSDYAVMEHQAAAKSPNAATLPPGVVLPLRAGWSDVGAWDALWQVLPKDSHGNVSQGDVLLQDCENTLALSEGRLVACVGVSDLVVVETADDIVRFEDLYGR